MKVVLDTNVLLAAFATRGLCEGLLDICLESHQIVLSEHILTELRRHLIKKIKMSTKRAGAIVAFLREYAQMVEPAKVPKNACRDADDLPVLGTVLNGQAQCLVTGDRDLLEIKHFHNVPIISPRTFYDSLRQ